MDKIASISQKSDIGETEKPRHQSGQTGEKYNIQEKVIGITAGADVSAAFPMAIEHHQATDYYRDSADGPKILIIDGNSTGGQGRI